MAGTSIRCLVVDDSAFMRSAVSRLLTALGDFEVVGQCADGASAVRLARELTPDVITMDFNMPGMNGAEATRRILAERPTPIVMLSAHTRDGAAETVEALAAGAVDFVTKPAGEVSADLSGVRDVLARKLRAAARANLRAVAPRSVPPARRRPAITGRHLLGGQGPATSAPPRSLGEPPASHREPPSTPRASVTPSAPRSLRPPRRAVVGGSRVIVIASSTGGPAALVRVVPELRAGAHALVIVQHMPSGFTAALAEQLAERSKLPFREARDGDAVEAGVALVAPGDQHLSIVRGRVLLTSDEPMHGVRPAADVTLEAAARSFGNRVVGVVLTGMGKDGARGLAAVKAAGGRTIAQDADTSTVYGMPRAAVELGVVDEVVALGSVAAAINGALA